MKSYFPIPYNPHNNPRPADESRPFKTQQKEVQQLMQENQILRRQLSTLLISQHTQPQPYLNLNQNKELHQIREQQVNNEEVEQIFKSKMQKLKTTKSCRKINAQIESACNSPNKNNQTTLEYDRVQQMQFAPASPQHHSDLKLMIVQKDSNGKFYRDRQSEDKIKTIANNHLQTSRTTNYSQPKPPSNYFPPQSNTQFRLTCQKKMGFCEGGNAVRGNFKSQNIPTFCINKTNEDFYSYVITKSTQRIQFSNPQTKKQIKSQKIHPIKSQQANSQPTKQKILPPRGAAYMEAFESQTNKNSADQPSPPDLQSMQSIIGSTADTKTKRKLRYDIYLTDVEKPNQQMR